MIFSAISKDISKIWFCTDQTADYQEFAVLPSQSIPYIYRIWNFSLVYREKKLVCNL